MTSFDEREKAFEAKFRLDQELAFKVNARKDKILGRWAAKQLGLEGEALENYAKSVVEADFEEPGDADVVRKIMKDFKAKNINISEEHLHKEMEHALIEAKRQVAAEVNK